MAHLEVLQKLNRDLRSLTNIQGCLTKLYDDLSGFKIANGIITTVSSGGFLFSHCGSAYTFLELSGSFTT